ncbi:MAG: GDSL-type esterase/lipase family protein [Acidimicrobiales bacterium]|nr:GDSL-type esterase/lipase family protein [Actinomycetota bacterium]
MSRRVRLVRRGIPAVLVVLLVAASAGFAVVSLTGSASTRGHTSGDGPKPRVTTTIPATTVPATTTTTQLPAPVWRVAWGAAMAWGYQVATDVTVRELARIGIGGRAVRVRISNAFGNVPLVVASATVALDASGPSIVAGTLHPLSFGGAPGVTVPVGGVVTSDPVTMTVHALQTLAVSLYVPGSDVVTLNPSRPGGPIVSYGTVNGGGDLVSASASPALKPLYGSWTRWVDSVDVLTARARGSIVVLGDSITAGFHTTLRWTHVLQERINMLSANDRRAVVNEGISANTLLVLADDDSRVGGGPAGLTRMAQDVLTQPGVSEMVLFLGTNDLWFGATASQLIAGMQQAIAMAHQAGIRVIGVTLLPRGGSVVDGRPWTPTMESYREQVNHWIRTSGAFNGVLDFAAVVRDAYNGACVPTDMFPPYDSGDHLHPGPAGQTAMADSVDTTILGMAPAPTVALLVPVTATPGCLGPTGVPTPAPPIPPAPPASAGPSTPASSTPASSTPAS